MEHVSIREVDPDPAPRSEPRRLSDALEAAAVAVNHYRLAPRERLAGLHAHETQEEVFVVLEGQATFETPDEAVTVDAGEAISFAPREHKSGTNQTDEPAVVLAIGAPPDGGDVFVPLDCQTCENSELRLELDDAGAAVVCPACEATRRPQCPDCGGEDLLAVRDGDRDRVVSACQDCGARFD